MFLLVLRAWRVLDDDKCSFVTDKSLAPNTAPLIQPWSSKSLLSSQNHQSTLFPRAVKGPAHQPFQSSGSSSQAHGIFPFSTEPGEPSTRPCPLHGQAAARSSDSFEGSEEEPGVEHIVSRRCRAPRRSSPCHWRTSGSSGAAAEDLTGQE